ncbi:histidine phosphatase family protein [Micrococcoides hystricis]|uniref:Histidine phosphatase family protein n=1 Tax=Micrococcoides hystricis TaxID=1572761 RepID=A0ABV6P7R1_9MICC
MSASTIYLLRHGQTDWNAEQRFQGSTDIPLNDIGRAQAHAVAPYMANLNPDCIVASPLQRAHHTALAVAERLDMQVNLDDRLRETEGGNWEGLTFAELYEKFPNEFSAWRSGVYGSKTASGESRVQLAERFTQAVEEARALTPRDGTLLVVAHGAAIRAAVPNLLGLPEEYWSVIGGLQNCHYHRLEWNSDRVGWRLAEMNVNPANMRI